MKAPRALAAPAEPLGAGAGSKVYAVPLLWLLSLAYACNYMDRSIVGTLAQAIKVDLQLTDAQLGILQGFAYVVLYSVAGIPIAWLAERRNRARILAVCLTAWSAMTMVCGVAQTFGQLLLLRVGVGVGEAGCNPCSHSMVADGFAPRQRSRALSIYQLGATIGTTVGAVSAGAIADALGWRMAFVIVGAPGVLLALVFALRVKDPARQPGDRRLGPGAPTAARRPDVVRAARQVFASPALIHIILGFTLASFVSGGASAFTQAYFVRAFGLSYGVVGAAFGLTGGLASAASLISGGRITDAAAPRDARWYVWLPTIGLALSVPCALGTYLAQDWWVALAWSFAGGFFLNWFIIPTLSVMHRLLGVRLVAAGMALILMFQNLVGLGGGPYVTGLIIDIASHRLFAHAGEFAALCPGGVGRHGAGVRIAAACHASLTQATRIGLLSSIVFRAWACLHYAVAARWVLHEVSRENGA